MEFFACAGEQAYSMRMDFRNPGLLRQDGLITDPLTPEQIAAAKERGERMERRETQDVRILVRGGIGILLGFLAMNALFSTEKR